MEKNLAFIDAKGVKFSINIKVTEKDLSKTLDYETLKPCSSKSKVLSITGECGFSCGQLYNSINPCTVAQQRLVDFWKNNHLNDCIPGTKKQMDYLKGGQYERDYEEVFFNVHEILNARGITKEKLCQFNKNDKLNGAFVTLGKILIMLFGKLENSRLFLHELGEASDGLHEVGTRLSLMLDVLTTSSMKNDYSIMRAFLAGRGLLEDRGYVYGTSWLYKPFDKEELERIINMIEQEEAEMKENNLADLRESYKNNKETEDENESEEEELPDIDTDSDELLNLVMNEKDCDETDAKRSIALMRAKDIDIEDLCNIDVVDDTQISYGHIMYYVASSADLKNLAREILHDEREFWVEAVKAGSTDQGLDEWIDDVIDKDGIGSTLGHYDGNEYEEEVMGEIFTIIRQ